MRLKNWLWSLALALFFPLAISFSLTDLSQLVISKPENVSGNVSIALISYGFNQTLYNQLAEEYNLSTEGIHYVSCPNSDNEDFQNWGTYSVAIIKYLAPNANITIFDCSNLDKLVGLPSNLSDFDFVSVLVNYPFTPFDDCSDYFCQTLSKYNTIAPAGFRVFGKSGEGNGEVTILVNKAKYGQPIALYNATIMVVSTQPVSVSIENLPQSCCSSLTSSTGKEYAVTCKIQSFYPDKECYYSADADQINVTINTNGKWKLKIFEWQSPTYVDVLTVSEGDFNYTLQSPCFAKVCVSALNGNVIADFSALGPSLVGFKPTFSAEGVFDFGQSPAYAVATATGLVALLLDYYKQMGLGFKDINWQLFAQPLGDENWYGYGKLLADFSKLIPKIEAETEGECYQNYCKVKVTIETPLNVTLCVYDNCKEVSSGTYEYILTYLPVANGNFNIPIVAKKGNVTLSQTTLSTFIYPASFNIKGIYAYPLSVAKGQNVTITIEGWGKDLDVFVNGLYVTTIAQLNGSFSFDWTVNSPYLNVTVQHGTYTYNKNITLNLFELQNLSQEFGSFGVVNGSLIIGNESFTKKLIETKSLFVGLEGKNCSWVGFYGDRIFCDGQKEYYLTEINSTDFSGIRGNFTIFAKINGTLYEGEVEIVNNTPAITAYPKIPFNTAGLIVNKQINNTTINFSLSTVDNKFKLNFTYQLKPPQIELIPNSLEGAIEIISPINTAAQVFVNGKLVETITLPANKKVTINVRQYLREGNNEVKIKYGIAEISKTFYYINPYKVNVTAFVENGKLHLLADKNVTVVITVNTHYVGNYSLSKGKELVVNISNYLINGQNIIVEIDYLGLRKFLLYDKRTKQNYDVGVYSHYINAPAIQGNLLSTSPFSETAKIIPGTFVKLNVTTVGNDLVISSPIPLNVTIKYDSKTLYEGWLLPHPINITLPYPNGKLRILAPGFEVEYRVFGYNITNKTVKFTENFTYYWGLFDSVSFERYYFPKKLVAPFGLINNSYYENGKEYLPHFLCKSYGKGEIVNSYCPIDTYRTLPFEPEPKIENGWFYVPFQNKTIAFRTINATFVLTACSEYCNSIKQKITLARDIFLISQEADKGWYSFGKYNVRLVNNTLEVDLNGDYKADKVLESGETLDNYTVIIMNSSVALAKAAKSNSLAVTTEGDKRVFWLPNNTIITIPTFLTAISPTGFLFNGERVKFVKTLVLDKAFLFRKGNYYVITSQNQNSLGISVEKKENAILYKQRSSNFVTIITPKGTLFVRGNFSLSSPYAVTIAETMEPLIPILFVNSSYIYAAQPVNVSINNLNYRISGLTRLPYSINEIITHNLKLIYLNNSSFAVPLLLPPNLYYSNGTYYTNLPVAALADGKRVVLLPFKPVIARNLVVFPFEGKDGKVYFIGNFSILNNLTQLAYYNVFPATSKNNFTTVKVNGVIIKFNDTHIKVEGGNLFVNGKFVDGGETNLYGDSLIEVYKGNELIFVTAIHSPLAPKVVGKEVEEERVNMSNQTVQAKSLKKGFAESEVNNWWFLIPLIAGGGIVFFLLWKRRKKKKYKQIYYKV